MLHFDMLAMGTGHKLQAVPPFAVQQGVHEHGVFDASVMGVGESCLVL